MLGSPLLDLLRRAQERLTACPSLTLFLATDAVQEGTVEDTYAAAVLASLTTETLDLTGTDAVDWIEGRLQEGATIPAPPPTVETPEPVAEERLVLAAHHVAQAWEHLESARKLLGATGEADLIAAQQQLEAMSRDLGLYLEGRVAQVMEAAE